MRRGVDADAVRRYLESIADEIRSLLEREAQLRRRVLEAERRAAEPPVLDEATLNRAVGAETARVLQTAHDAAREVVARTEARAGELIAEAEAHAADRISAAEEEASAALEAAAEEAATLAASALAEATALQESTQAEAEALAEAAQQEAVALLEATKERCRNAVREAQQARKSVLSDLLDRRRTLFVQLEQLRSGRDSLVEVVDAVGGAVEELRRRLAMAEHDARVAAAEGGDRAEARADDEVDTLLDPEIALELQSGLLGDDVNGLVEAVVEAVVEAEIEAAEAIVGGFDDVADDVGAGEQEDTAASHRSVGELFARIRASRGRDDASGVATSAHDDTDELAAAAELALAEQAVARAEPETVVAVPTAGIEDTAETVVVSAPGAGEDAAGVPDEGGATAAGEDAADDVLPAATEAGDALPAAMDADDAAVIARRDVLVAPVVTRLARALKRALQDDQNELLNAIRHASGAADLDALLPEDFQSERYAQAASGALADGWLVGRQWLVADGADGVDDEVVGSLATETGRALGTELAGELAGLLRHRLTESLRALGDVNEGAQDAAGAAYREWKGARVEGIAGDFATRAFAGGAVAAGEGTIVRWIVDDGGPCPDCDDNALAGEQLAGDEWPTGQLHPPVHPGCRCLLVAIAR